MSGPNTLVLSLFPGIGLLVIGGPPCTRWSPLANIVRAVYGEPYEAAA